VPTTDLSSPWLESLRRSRARRFAANRARRRRWSGRTGAGVLLASLTLAAGGALAQGGGSASPQAVSVAAIQGALGIPADGIAGPQTRRAIKAFQRAHGLTPDGVAGPATLAALGLTQAGGSRSLDATATATATATPQASDAQTVLAKIAQCESGGDPTAISRDRQYRGKYQFTRATWRLMGGTGDPAKADEATQDALAAKLYAQQGTSPWPVCGAGLS
jgi:peptidoglycan hydrolase-like protein with peptidoglycan-binding domain